MTNAGTQPVGELALRTVAMPADTNPAGDIFGGWIMSLMDLAAGVSAGTIPTSSGPAELRSRWQSRRGCCAAAKASGRG